MAVYSFDLLKVQERLGHHGIEWEEERGQEPNSDTFPKAAGSQLLLLLILLLYFYYLLLLLLILLFIIYYYSYYSLLLSLSLLL